MLYPNFQIIDGKECINGNPLVVISNDNSTLNGKTIIQLLEDLDYPPLKEAQQLSKIFNVVCRCANLKTAALQLAQDNFGMLDIIIGFSKVLGIKTTEAILAFNKFCYSYLN